MEMVTVQTDQQRFHNCEPLPLVTLQTRRAQKIFLS